MVVYAIERRSDDKIIYSTTSKAMILDKMRKYYDRRYYRIVIL